MNYMKKLAAIYSKQLISNPLRTNIVTGGILAAGSDIICQTLIEEQDDEPFNYKRTLAITTFGMYYNGGLCSFIYPLYARILPQWFSRSLVRQGIGSTLIDNFIHSPIFYIPAFYMSTGILQGHSFTSSFATLKHGYQEVMLQTWMMWIPLQALNFSIVPPRMRVLVLSVGCFVYTIQLDFLLENGRKTLLGEQNAKKFKKDDSKTCN